MIVQILIAVVMTFCIVAWISSLIAGTIRDQREVERLEREFFDSNDYRQWKDIGDD